MEGEEAAGEEAWARRPIMILTDSVLPLPLCGVVASECACVYLCDKGPSIQPRQRQEHPLVLGLKNPNVMRRALSITIHHTARNHIKHNTSNQGLASQHTKPHHTKQNKNKTKAHLIIIIIIIIIPNNNNHNP